MDISKLSVQELKALAYDVLAQIQGLQNDLGALNQAIAEKSKEKEEKPIEDVVEAPVETAEV